MTLSMAPLASRASTACWRSWRLFLAQKLMHWWVSRGQCRKDMHTPSSTVLVARKVPSKLRHCGAKSARRAPTWTPSMLAGWGSCSSCLGLPTLSWGGSVSSSPAGTCTKGLILGNHPLNGSSNMRTQVLEHWSSRMLFLLGWGSLLRAGLGGFLGFLDECHQRSRHTVSLPDGPDPLLQNLGLRTQDMGPLKGSSPHSAQNLRLETKVLKQSVLPSYSDHWTHKYYYSYSYSASTYSVLAQVLADYF